MRLLAAMLAKSGFLYNKKNRPHNKQISKIALIISSNNSTYIAVFLRKLLTSVKESIIFNGKVQRFGQTKRSNYLNIID